MRYAGLLAGVGLVLVFSAGAAQAVLVDPNYPDGMYKPPEETGPQTLTHDGVNPDTKIHHFYSWPDYLTGMKAGTPWRLEVTGIDMTGVVGPSGRSIYFQLVDISPDGAGWWYWHSLNINTRLDLPLNPTTMGDVCQMQETFDRTGLWDNISSQWFQTGQITYDDFGLRFDFYKANADDPWTVTPAYRMAGGDWTVFSEGTAITTNSWDFGTAPDGWPWTDYGGVVFDVHFSHGAYGELSFDNARIYGVPEPVTMAGLMLGVGALGGYLRRRRA